MTDSTSPAHSNSNVTTLTAVLAGVKHIILVLSGKGGVGKSSVTTQLALSLAATTVQATGRPATVGVLDIDLCGPSIPRMLGVDSTAQILTSSHGWVPYQLPSPSKKVKVMSIGFLLPNKDDAVVWRGPKKTAMIHQFITDVCWGECDYLVIDTPPGTSDEHIAIMEALRPFPNKSAVIVTTPQAVAISDVRKEISFCHKVKLPIVGVVENMSGFRCPHCADCTNIFSAGGGKKLADEYSLQFLGALPIDPAFAQLVDTLPTASTTGPVEESAVAHGPVASLLDVYPGTAMSQDFAKVTEKVVAKVAELSRQTP
ncbi:P-loop containing nucleoside triphosphate hydrolase protein [Catenaria anguillulae PL171]|uniref:p-loop containing nucleoside triphosphate hydrolase protein n=1 Tax=Catenaria anguillulae PL171 TaxID=765915 RepID=A0A1Y2HEW5_9FUNG|nr:P-loop containing nucleoside triphosphate hydrolase protein [Catenaria anguillulae PL171]